MLIDETAKHVSCMSDHYGHQYHKEPSEREHCQKRGTWQKTRALQPRGVARNGHSRSLHAVEQEEDRLIEVSHGLPALQMFSSTLSTPKSHTLITTAQKLPSPLSDAELNLNAGTFLFFLWHRELQKKWSEL